MRFRDTEFRWSKVNNKYELVKWYKAEVDGNEEREYCYVLAFFDETKEGYDMRILGGRFFEDKDAFIVGKHAIGFLNSMFWELKKEEELE
jgi:hypothetical protein